MVTPVRNIVTHRVNPVNDQLVVSAIEAPNGEPITYTIGVPHGPDVTLNFQVGPIGEVGVNGVTNEALLAIVLDRLGFFQQGEFKCRENALAITKIEEGMLWLFARTLARIHRGVEGTRVP